MDIALKGHFLTHMPHPVQRISDMIGLSSSNWMASMLLLIWGQNRKHALSHRFGLHLALSTTAILILAHRYQLFEERKISLR